VNKFYEKNYCNTENIYAAFLRNGSWSQCMRESETRLSMNPSPLIPLPIGWGEGGRRQFIGVMPRLM